MLRAVLPSVVLLLVVLQAPPQAQALVSSFLPGFTANEPVTLVLTGLALLGLARVSGRRTH